MIFRFRKLYADVVTPEGWVGILYQTELRLCGIYQRSNGFELYSPDGERTVVRAEHSTPMTGPNDLAFETSMRGSFGSLNARYRPLHRPFKPERPPADGLEWHNHVPDAEVRWDLKLGDSTLKLTGRGYADFVTLHRIPRRLGIDKLAWGRIYQGESATVFVAAELKKDKTRPRLFHNGRTADRFSLTRDGSRWRLELPDEVGGAGEREVITWRADRVLHQGPALDEERFPSRLERYVSKLLSGSIMESRYVGRLENNDNADQAFIINEEVHFGDP